MVNLFKNNVRRYISMMTEAAAHLMPKKNQNHNIDDVIV